jgi:hypothetical protein
MTQLEQLAMCKRIYTIINEELEPAIKQHCHSGLVYWSSVLVKRVGELNEGCLEIVADCLASEEQKRGI